jgi:hypothetical protein
MSMKRTKTWARGMLALPILAVALALCGCESEDTDENITPTRFNISRELRNYSDTDEYVWETTVTEPLATLRINDFTEGDTSIRIYDGRGVLVLSAALNTFDNASTTSTKTCISSGGSRAATPGHVADRAGVWRLHRGLRPDD